MLEFADIPYRFVPPCPNPLLISLAQFVIGKFALPGKNHLVKEIEIRGSRALLEARQKNCRFVILPNHSTHSDPQVMGEVCRRLSIRPSFMAAYDVFARSRLQSWLMQRTGAFSVDRDGSDRKSMKCATEVVIDGKYPLILFPEGNVYLCNDQVTPFAEGASYIALRAQKTLGADIPVFAVPVSMKYTFLEDIRQRLRESLDEIAGQFDTKLDPEADFAEELKRISTTALRHFLTQRGYLPPDGTATVDEQVAEAAEQLIVALEAKINLQPGRDSGLTGRIRRIRAAVHAVRTDDSREVDHRAAVHWADEAILALRILGYQGGYMASQPTLDRVAETVARLREDVHSRLFPPDGKRRCIVEIGTPLDLRDRLEPFHSKARQAIGDLTRDCEAAVQSGLDAINAGNDSVGARLF